MSRPEAPYRSEGTGERLYSCFKKIVSGAVGLDRHCEVGSRRVLVHGLRVCYDIAGNGPNVLFVHGWAGSRLHWEQAPYFLPHCRIVSPDLYGFGESEEPDHVAMPNDYVELLSHLVGVLKIEHCILVGHSVGGLVAATLAVHNPGKVDGLVLIEAPVAKELQQLNCPILLIYGDQHSHMEGLPRVDAAKAQSANNLSAQIRFIDKAGHNPMLERPTEFYCALREFVENVINTKHA